MTSCICIWRRFPVKPAPYRDLRLDHEQTEGGADTCSTVSSVTVSLCCLNIYEKCVQMRVRTAVQLPGLCLRFKPDYVRIKQNKVTRDLFLLGCSMKQVHLKGTRRSIKKLKTFFPHNFNNVFKDNYLILIIVLSFYILSP